MEYQAYCGGSFICESEDLLALLAAVREELVGADEDAVVWRRGRIVAVIRDGDDPAPYISTSTWFGADGLVDGRPANRRR